MTRLTPSVKNQITRDWNDLFPSLAVYRPMHLLRRVGPVLIGVCLERDSTNEQYRPVAHVHSLCRVFPVVTLSLSSQAHDEKMRLLTIRVAEHKESYQSAAVHLREYAYVPIEGELTLADVIQGYWYYLESPTATSKSKCFEDMALICAWHGDTDMSQRVIETAANEMQRWPEQIRRRIDGVHGWATRLASATAEPARVRMTVDQQIKALGLGKVPAQELAN